jgi:hypothetical protein
MIYFQVDCLFDNLQTCFCFWISFSVLNSILVQSHNEVQTVAIGLSFLV